LIIKYVPKTVDANIPKFIESGREIIAILETAIGLIVLAALLVPNLDCMDDRLLGEFRMCPALIRG